MDDPPKTSTRRTSVGLRSSWYCVARKIRDVEMAEPVVLIGTERHVLRDASHGPRVIGREYRADAQTRSTTSSPVGLTCLSICASWTNATPRSKGASCPPPTGPKLTTRACPAPTMRPCNQTHSHASGSTMCGSRLGRERSVVAACSTTGCAALPATCR